MNSLIEQFEEDKFTIEGFTSKSNFKMPKIVFPLGKLLDSDRMVDCQRQAETSGVGPVLLRAW